MKDHTDRQKACIEALQGIVYEYTGSRLESHHCETIFEFLEVKSPITGFSEPDGGADVLTDERLTELAVDHLHIDYDRMPAGVVPLLRAAIALAGPSLPAAPVVDVAVAQGEAACTCKGVLGHSRNCAKFDESMMRDDRIAIPPPRASDAPSTAAHAGATWKLVPVEPTETMVTAANEVEYCEDGITHGQLRAAINAAPTPSATAAQGATSDDFRDQSIIDWISCLKADSGCKQAALEHLEELYQRLATFTRGGDKPVAYVCSVGATRVVLMNGAKLNDFDELYARPAAPTPVADSGAITDERLTELAVDHLHIDYDRMPAGVVPLLRAAIGLATAPAALTHEQTATLFVALGHFKATGSVKCAESIQSILATQRAIVLVAAAMAQQPQGSNT